MRKFDIEESRLLKLLTSVIDILLMCLCLVGCYYFYESVNPSVNNGVDLQTYLVTAVLCYLPMTFFFPVLLFERTTRGDKVVERAFQLALAHIILFFAVLFLLKTEAIARILLLTFAGVFWAVLTKHRLLTLYAIRSFRRRGRNGRHVIFVGHVDEMQDLYEYMKNREFGYKILGIFSDEPTNMEKVPTLGGTDDVLPFLQTHKYVDAVYCTMARMSKENLIALYKYCENHLLRFYAQPVYLSCLRRTMHVMHVGSTILLYPRREPLRVFENRLIKRILDLVVSSFFLLTFFPIIYVVVAIIIKRQSPGPVIFIQ